MMSYPEILAELFNQKYGIAVTGTHGKTTTSAMLANTLKELGEDLKAVIGSKVLNWSGNALNGKGKYFVIEADEFQNKLKMYDPKVVLLTNLDWDHPDTYPTFEDYKKAFEDFVTKIPETGFLVSCGDDKNVLEISKKVKCPVLTYGFSKNCDYFISKAKGKNFSVELKGEKLGNFEIQLIGKHNILNAASVIAVCHKLNFDVENIRGALKNFKGTKRRFEYIGQKNGAILIDDYGHHPEEIKATLKGAKEIYPKKNITAVFHPHSYSRTEALLEEFSRSFSDADKVIVLDIYGSVREGSGQVNSRNLVDLINKENSGKAQYLPTISETVDFLKNKVSEKDVILCIGAGNVFEVAENLKELRN